MDRYLKLSNTFNIQKIKIIPIFFEVNLLLVLDSLNKKNFVKTSKLLTNLKAFQQNGTYEFIIYDTLKSYNKLFWNGIIESPNQNFR